VLVISSSEESATAATAAMRGGEVGGVCVLSGNSLQRSLKSEDGVADRLDSDESRVSVSDL
jgi:hypothetical protein